ncbi:MAG: 4-hydroxybenzoate octaprenyltransferase [Chromatiales bacterium]|nr:4-hydroxybenzoate octaprenyltransferase [Chromatiales bacterium]
MNVEMNTKVSMTDRLAIYAKLIRFHRPIGTLLLLWPALWALWLASDGKPPWAVVVIFILGVFLMRSAGCAINDYADRGFDDKVERTVDRPLAQGLIKPKEALMVFGVLVLCAFGLVLLLNNLTIMMSVVAVVLATIYPFMKRYTHLPQLVLGMAFGWAVPMAFTAIDNAMPPPYVWILFITTVIWVLIYDTEYAMVDREDDLKVGIKSTAILFGENDRLMIGILQLVTLGLLVLVGIKAEMGFIYYLGVMGAGLSALYQQYLIREREPANCFRAFLENNTFGMVIFIGIFLDYMVRGWSV